MGPYENENFNALFPLSFDSFSTKVFETFHVTVLAKLNEILKFEI